MSVRLFRKGAVLACLGAAWLMACPAIGQNTPAPTVAPQDVPPVQPPPPGTNTAEAAPAGGKGGGRKGADGAKKDGAKGGGGASGDVREEIITKEITITKPDGSKETRTEYETNRWLLEKKESAPLSVFDNIVRFNAGVMLLNPYSITNNDNGETTHLDDGDSQARFFVEVAAHYTWAWSPQRRWEWVAARQRATEGMSLAKLFQGSRVYEKYPGEIGIGVPDFQGRINYIAQDDNKETSAAAIVGTGEFGMETTLGIPFYQALNTYSGTYNARSALELYNDTFSAHWVGGVLSWSGTTDGGAFDIHSRYFVGVGYRAAFKAPWESGTKEERREVGLNFQMGAAWVDAITYSDKSERAIKADSLGVPDYEAESALGVEAEVYIPLTKSLNGVVGARFYPLSGDDSPNTWNAYVALSLDLTKLKHFFE